MKWNAPINYFKNRTRGIVFGRTRLGDFVNSFYDLYIFLKYSFTVNHLKSKKNYQAFLTKQYHIIEKGLSLPSPRQNFGKDKIEVLLRKTKQYITNFGEDHLTTLIRNCLSEYLQFNPNLQKEYPLLAKELNSFIGQHVHENVGGTKVIDRVHLEKSTDINFREFVKTRVSVRNFDPRVIDFKDVEEAVDIAKYAPSVCNRQAWNLHFYDDRNVMDILLKLQAGNSGFTESIKGLLIVTTDTSQFTKLERNQVFVDGGLFSMNLLLSLHSKGFGSCCLNTCVPYTTEIKIKKIAGILEKERLIMMIGIGYLKEEFKTAYSQKKDISDILINHSN